MQTDILNENPKVIARIKTKYSIIEADPAKYHNQ